MSLLTPDSGLLFWMIVSFGIVFVILSKYGFPVIVKAIEQRKAYIDNSLETARQANERLAHIQAEGERSPLGDSGSVYRYRRESNERENRPG